MSERGVYAVDRGIWEHPLFVSDMPFSRREAWMWLLSEATWKAKTIFVDGRRLALKRGQLAHSLRFLAEKWGWPKSNVARFLDVLKSEDMIGTDGGAGITVITVSKYNEYQKVSLPERDSVGAESGTRAGHERDKEETKENKKEERGGGGDARARDPLVTPRAIKLAEEIAEIAGFPTATDWPPGWCGAPMRVQSMLSHGWQPEIMLAAAREIVAKKRDGPPDSIKYFEKPFARAHAQYAAPLPVVVGSLEPEKVHGQHRAGSAQGGYPGSGKNHAAHAIEAFERAARGYGSEG